MVNGKPAGYIKSVSVRKQKFDLTPNKHNAKGYATADSCQHEIDKLAAIAYGTNTVFIYD